MKHDLKQTLGIQYPIFQAPMAGGIVSPDLVAEVSAFGMLGSIPSGYLNLSQSRDFINAVKEKTSNPFSLNLFVDYMNYADIWIEKPNEIITIERNFDKNSCPFFRIAAGPSMDELIQLAIDCEVPFISTTFGLLSAVHISALKTAGIKLMTTVNSAYEVALALNLQQPDILIFQNVLAGGHKGGSTPLPHSTEDSVLQALHNHPEVYCVLAGAIVTKSDIKNALARGFDGVQIGTGFLMTQESCANENYKMAILANQETAFTTSITGKPARGLKNRLADLQITDNLGFPYMHYATSSLRKLAKLYGNTDYQSLWCGDGIAKINTLPTLSDYMKSLTL